MAYQIAPGDPGLTYSVVWFLGKWNVDSPAEQGGLSSETFGRVWDEIGSGCLLCTPDLETARKPLGMRFAFSPASDIGPQGIPPNHVNFTSTGRGDSQPLKGEIQTALANGRRVFKDCKHTCRRALGWSWAEATSEWRLDTTQRCHSPSNTDGPA